MTINWLVLRTRSNHETVVQNDLSAKNIVHYLPTRHESRQWKDRKKKLELPLFPGYIFLKPESQQFHSLKYIRGSCGLLLMNNKPATVQEKEVDRIRRVANSGINLESHPLLQPGESAQIANGPLKGLVGELIRIKNQNRLVIHSYILGQSVSLEVNIEDVEKASPHGVGPKPD